jgi:hypothetical protein
VGFIQPCISLSRCNTSDLTSKWLKDYFLQDQYPTQRRRPSRMTSFIIKYTTDKLTSRILKPRILTAVEHNTTSLSTLWYSSIFFRSVDAKHTVLFAVYYTMEPRDSQQSGDTTYLVSPEDVHRLSKHVCPSLEAMYICFPLLVAQYHCVGVTISLVPFSLREFPGQVFYCAKGGFARCCDKIQQEPVQSSINEAAETIYKNLVP